MTRSASANIVICQLCRKRLHKQRNGAWYHDHNSSEFCHPGDGTRRKAVPLHIKATRPAQGDME